MGLKAVAKANTSVSKLSKGGAPKVIQEGKPVDPSDKCAKSMVTSGGIPMVGVNVGATLNMGDFQSLRLDCWVTDTLKKGETHQEALERITAVVQEHMTELRETMST